MLNITSNYLPHKIPINNIYNTREYPVQKTKKMEANSPSTKLWENLAVKLKFPSTNMSENL